MGKNLKGRECGKGICQRKDGKYAARYTAKDGNPRTVWELVSDRISFAEPKAAPEKKKQVDADDDLPFPME